MKLVDVLIVGAGPTGLVLAIECARYGLTFRIIDQLDAPLPYSRAIALQARTLEILQRIGIHRSFLEAGLRIKAANFYSKHKSLSRVDLQMIPSSFPFVLSLEQSRTETILTDYLEELGGDVERSTRLISYEEKGEVVLADTNQGTIPCHYLVGCDGAHSSVRKTMGCTFKGKTWRDIFSLADVAVDWRSTPDEVHIFLESEGIMALFPLPEKNRYRLIFQLKRLRNLLQPNLAIEHGLIASDEIKLPTLSEIQCALASYSQESVKVSDPRWIANFHINSRLSNRYKKGRIFLAGDAAHIHSPVGGQGMNTGMQDAFNLAWKLAYVHRYSASRTLLESYEHERHKIGEQLLKATEGASRLATLHSPPLLFARNYLLSFLLSFDAIHSKILSAISETNLESPFKRVPTMTLLDNGKETDFYTLSEASTSFHLILFNVPESPIHHPNIRVLHARGTSLPKALFVRPDGYLALEDRPPFTKLRALSQRLLTQ